MTRFGSSTEHAGVIGDPVAHSLSPVLHRAAYAAIGRSITYHAYKVASGNAEAAVRGAAALGFVGLSVTTPHKEAVIAAIDELSMTARRIGAVNTVVFRGDKVLGDSTDGEGFVGDLVSSGVSLQSAHVVVLGAGGAARAVLAALVDAGAEVVVVNRTSARAKATIELLGGGIKVGSLADLAEADIIVNATSVGLSGSAGEATERWQQLGSRLSPGQLAYDLIYSPPETPFLSGARAAGATTRNGLGMLVHQAGLQVERFTGLTAPLEAMWAAVRAV